jgi:general stress protein YciG
MSHGFAKLKEENPERLKEIASKGGQASHAGGFAKLKEEDPGIQVEFKLNC